MVSDLNSAHTRAMKELVDQIVTLQNERRETEVALTENVGKITVSYPLPTIRLRPSLTARFKNTNETLRAELERAKNNLTLRSAVGAQTPPSHMPCLLRSLLNTRDHHHNTHRTPTNAKSQKSC
jgi:hypothetical protein